MRSFNKARLIDIADKGLDPKQPHVVGPDGRLTSDFSSEKDSQETKDEKKDADVQEPVVQEKQQVIFAQTTTNVEKKSKSTKSTKKSN